MKSTQAWEIRGLKIFCALSAVPAALMLLLRLTEIGSSPPLVVFLWLGACSLWLTGTLYVISSSTEARYTTQLIIAMAATFIGVYVFTIADVVRISEISDGQVLIGGRASEQLFSQYGALIILGAFLARVRAVLIWFALCSIFPIQGALFLLSEPQIYFTSDQAVLAVDGNSLNYGLLAYIAIYIIAATQGASNQLNAWLLSWHWMEIAGFFVFMFLAPQTIIDIVDQAEMMQTINALQHEVQSLKNQMGQ